MTGYAHPRYAASLAEFGEPYGLPRAGGAVLLRGIPGTEWRDAMGPYPLFCCNSWASLGADLTTLADAAVSVSLVADPFGDHDEAMLRSAFDVVVDFKRHHVIDTRQASRPRRRHRDYARQALRHVRVDLVTDPQALVDEWQALYGHLIARHEIRGIRAFSRAAFELQLTTPGMVAFTASHAGRTVAAHLWYVMGEVAHSHLMASDATGYTMRAMYALHAAAIDHFRPLVRWINLGGGAGIGRADDNGLSRFKSGWTSESRTVKFCGRILNADRYREAIGVTGVMSNTFFPAYRTAEFT